MQNANDKITLAANIKAILRDVGFAISGITDVGAISEFEQKLLEKCLREGYCADMGFMHRNLEKRIEPGKMLEGAKSVICAGLHYKTTADSGLRCLASYSVHPDYHDCIKNKLLGAIEQIRKLAGDFHFKICVDSSPVAEKSLSARAGLGFIGKNHLLVTPALGCKILLGEIITDIDLACDEPIANRCGECNQCVKACPTGALRPDGCFDANRCISYLTIEHKGELPAEIKARFGDSVFGCDRCILACPFEKNAPPASIGDFAFRQDIADLGRGDIANIDEDRFKKLFGNTVVFRTGLERLKRNAQPLK